MLSHLLRSTAVVLALSGAIAPASAQQPEATQSVPATPPAAGSKSDGQVSGPTATQPSDAATSPDAQTMAQPVPGAMPNSQTVPSTISERNAEADKLITMAWTFHTLTDKQRSAIWSALKGKPTGAAFNAEVGNVLPSAVKLETIPQSVVQQVPQAAGYRFAVTGDRILLVSPIDSFVVGVVKE